MVSQYDIQPMVQIYATPQGRDLGAVAADVRTVIADTAKDVPKGSSVVLLGQVQTMNSAFSGLLFGLLGAIVLIYLLIVVNFQSWSDPFVIITALPAALAGIVWMLFATQTTLSVPALTGAIMCMGVATANSVLVISFARERYEELGDPVAAALEAGFVRFRPVLMTALAMIIGMAPMALGLGEGGEQNAPLGRAVIGGLIFATVATLMFVPVVFSMVHKKQGAKAAAAPETVACPLNTARRSRAGSWAFSGLWRASPRCWWWSPVSGRARIPSAKLREWTDNQAIPTVAVVLPDAKVLNATIDLPGRLEAYYRAPIFARVSGYLKSWSVDIGAKVKAGQVIAEIEAPDLDQQLLQARADLASQEASAKLSEVTLTRRKTLIASNFVSMQEIDERTADLSNKKAAVNSGQANVERLEALAGYKKITVPFDGVVTARDTDVGALINAGGGSGPAMFVISDIKKLRVYVNVPQNYVPAIKIGAKAVITMPEYPNRTFAGDGRGFLAIGRCRFRHDADAARRSTIPRAS